jgi:hypothetical protein
MPCADCRIQLLQAQCCLLLSRLAAAKIHPNTTDCIPPAASVIHVHCTCSPQGLADIHLLQAASQPTQLHSGTSAESKPKCHATAEGSSVVSHPVNHSTQQTRDTNPCNMGPVSPTTTKHENSLATGARAETNGVVNSRTISTAGGRHSSNNSCWHVLAAVQAHQQHHHQLPPIQLWDKKSTHPPHPLTQNLFCSQHPSKPRKACTTETGRPGNGNKVVHPLHSSGPSTSPAHTHKMVGAAVA